MRSVLLITLPKNKENFLKTVEKGIELSSLPLKPDDQTFSVPAETTFLRRVRLWGLPKRYQDLWSRRIEKDMTVLFKEGNVEGSRISTLEGERKIKYLLDRLTFSSFAIIYGKVKSEILSKLLWREEKYPLILVLENFTLIPERIKKRLTHSILNVLLAEKLLSKVHQPTPTELTVNAEVFFKKVLRDFYKIHYETFVTLVLAATYVSFCQIHRNIHQMDEYTRTRLSTIGAVPEYVIVHFVNDLLFNHDLTPITKGLLLDILTELYTNRTKLLRLASELNDHEALTTLRVAPTYPGQYLVLFKHVDQQLMYKCKSYIDHKAHTLIHKT